MHSLSAVLQPTLQALTSNKNQIDRKEIVAGYFLKLLR